MPKAIVDVMSDVDAKIAFYEQEAKVKGLAAKKARNRLRLWKSMKESLDN